MSVFAQQSPLKTAILDVTVASFRVPIFNASRPGIVHFKLEIIHQNRAKMSFIVQILTNVGWAGLAGWLAG